jgi:hypothetical protein
MKQHRFLAGERPAAAVVLGGCGQLKSAARPTDVRELSGESTTMKRSHHVPPPGGCLVLPAALLLAAVGCQTPPPPPAPAALTITVTSPEPLPADACLRVTGAGGASLQLAISGGSKSVQLTVGGFPPGAATVGAEAFPAACPAAGLAPSWASDRVTANLEPSRTAAVALTLHRTASAPAAVTFADDYGD